MKYAHRQTDKHAVNKVLSFYTFNEQEVIVPCAEGLWHEDVQSERKVKFLSLSVWNLALNQLHIPASLTPVHTT